MHVLSRAGSRVCKGRRKKKMSYVTNQEFRGRDLQDKCPTFGADSGSKYSVRISRVKFIDGGANAADGPRARRHFNYNKYSLLTEAAAGTGLTGVFFLRSTYCDVGVTGFLVLVGDGGDDAFVLVGFAAATLGRTGMCWSSANRTWPRQGFWTDCCCGCCCCRVCAAHNRTTRADRHRRFRADIVTTVRLWENRVPLARFYACVCIGAAMRAA